MAEVAEGKALLRNFRLRQQLKLLPGRSQPAGTVSLKRLELLLNHESFGYESEQIVEPPVTCEISKRKEALQQQLEELKVTKEAEMSQMRNAELAAQSLQQEMAKMVDEHEILTRQRCELSARQKELADETLRLQAVLTDLAEDETQSVQKDEDETVQSSEQIAKMAERLKLHHLHLQRLLAEQKLLQQQLGASGNQAMGWWATDCEHPFETLKMWTKKVGYRNLNVVLKKHFHWFMPDTMLGLFQTILDIFWAKTMTLP